MATNKKLPIFKYKSKIIDAVKENQVVIVVGQTGCGKSTQVAQYLHDNKTIIGLKKTSTIACLHPRSIAAITLAERVAHETNTSVGTLVGYRTRFDSKYREQTEIVYMTVGFMSRIFSSRIGAYGIVIIDEAHERSVETDIVLGLMKQRLKSDKQLRLVVMSATLDVEEIEAFFPQAVTVRVDKVPEHVSVEYRPIQSQDYVAEIVNLVIELISGDQGHILIFLPSEEKIHRCAKVLKEAKTTKNLKFVVLKFYSTMENHKKKKVFSKCEGRQKIIVATNIAETSLTIEGVDIVIDSGLVNGVFYDHESRVERWKVMRVSHAEAEQRKGRTGRTGEGKCYRMFKEFEVNPTKDLSASLRQIPFVTNMNEREQSGLVTKIQSRYSLGQLRAIERISSSFKKEAALTINSRRSLFMAIDRLFTKDEKQSTLFILDEDRRQQLSKVMASLAYIANKEEAEQHAFVEEIIQRFSLAQLHCVIECKDLHFKKIESDEDIVEKLENMFQERGIGDDCLTERRFSIYPTPEIKLANLGSMVLRLKSMNFYDVMQFPFIVPPVLNDVELATEHLYELALLWDDLTLTHLGLEVSRLPLSPALGKLAAIGRRTNSRHHILVILAMLSVRCIFQSLKKGHEKNKFNDGDLIKLLYAYDQAWESGFNKEVSKKHGMHHSNLLYADLIVQQLERNLPIDYDTIWDYNYDIEEITSVFLSGFFQNLSLKNAKGDVYTLVNGKECKVADQSCVARTDVIMPVLLQSSLKDKFIKMRHCTAVSKKVLMEIDLNFYRIRPQLWSQMSKKFHIRP